MGDSLIASTDAGALADMQAFSTNISLSPGTYGLGQPDSVAIAAAVAAYAVAFGASSNMATRTPAAIDLKDQKRAAAEALVRMYAAQIRADLGVSDQAKIDLKITIPGGPRESRQCPQSSPIVGVIASTVGAQTVRYSDSLTPDSRAKPLGAENIQIFVAIGAENVQSPAEAEFYGAYTRNPVPVVFGQEHRGKQATYFARWGGKQGDVGQWSAPVSLTIAA